jgi:hypothetical protein
MTINADTIRTAPIEWVADLSCRDTVRYAATDDEVAAIRWLGNRYAISAYLLSTLDDGVFAIDPMDLVDALREDGVDRVPCLSDETSLQRLVWAMGS